jgi:hypothetical protein
MSNSRRTTRAPRRAAALLAAVLLAGCAGNSASRSASTNDPNHEDWIQLFNGKNLDGWVPKFTHYPLGENFNDTFRVENGLLEVRYDKYKTWGGEWGHLFYKTPFSYYIISAEYRFVGEQVAGAGPGAAWAIRNNGLMLHSQSPESMGLDQDYPISMEDQLLGGLGKGPRPTANLCTPGTNMVMNGQLVTRHCTNSTSKTYDGDQWVTAGALVLGDSVVKHIVEGDTVLEYTKPQMGGGSANNLKPGVMQPGKLLSSGYITIQAETAPIDFRKIEVLNLEGCTDPKASNYKTYFIKSDNTQCKYGR